MRLAPPSWTALLALGLPLLAPAPALAQKGGPYDLTWNVLGGGGLTFSGAGVYRVGGTVGQSDPGRLTGGAFQLKGGFWADHGAILVGVEGGQPGLPATFRVLPNVPNPFNAVTSIAFELPTEQRVEMSVYDLNGDRVRQLLDQVMPAGRHHLVWAGIGDAGRPLPPGVYWIQTRAGEQRAVLKTVLIR